jgi:hypothetical protein
VRQAILDGWPKSSGCRAGKCNAAGSPSPSAALPAWPVARTQSADWLEERFSRLSRARPSYQYSRHGVDEPDDLFTLTGAIRCIEALHYDLHAEDDPNLPGDTSLFPTVGTERLTTVESDHMWEMEPNDMTRQSFAGWIVEVDVADLERLEIEDARQEYRPKVLDRAVVWYPAFGPRRFTGTKRNHRDLPGTARAKPLISSRPISQTMGQITR